MFWLSQLMGGKDTNITMGQVITFVKFNCDFVSWLAVSFFVRSDTIFYLARN